MTGGQASIAIAATTRKMNAIHDSRPRRTFGRSKRFRSASTGAMRAAARAGSMAARMVIAMPTVAAYRLRRRDRAG